MELVTMFSDLSLEAWCYTTRLTSMYRCVLHHPNAQPMEKWISTKDSVDDKSPSPRWHVPVEEEISFANELMSLHFQAALDELLKIWQEKTHTDTENEKKHLKVTLLRIDSSLQGILSCMPDFTQSFTNKIAEDSLQSLFLVAGAAGATIASSEMRGRAAEVMHEASRYLLEEKSDDSILLILIIRIMDALLNHGSLEYDEWSNHRQAWRLEYAAIVEPSINFITNSHSYSKRRPLWAIVDKAYMHNNTWRASQSSFHLYRTSKDVGPSNYAVVLYDLLSLALHKSEIVRSQLIWLEYMQC